MKKNSNFSLWIITGFLLIALLFARVVYSEYLWLTIGICVPLVASLAALIRFNQKALRSRSTAYGVNSLVTVILVIGIVGVLNFLGSRYPYRIDLTKNKIHTLSDETVKLVKGLQKPVKATLFSKIGQREKDRPLLENYKELSTKFDVEYVDPDREPTAAREAGVKKYGTLHLQVGSREANVDELTEETITNALIKLARDKVPTLCAITGHGEHSFSSSEADGYAAMKKALLEQSYDLKEVSLLQENKVPDDCDGIAIMGPTKSFFPPEIKILQDYLNNGGRALIAVDLNIKGSEYSPELLDVLKNWYVKPDTAMVVDPLSRALGVDAAVPIIATFSKQSPITRDFQGNCYFPFSRPLEIIQGSPAGMTVQWLAQTTPRSFAVSDMKQLASGEVKVKPGQTKMGPLDAAIVVDGRQKDSKAKRDTRMVVFGNSAFATNNYSRYGGNSDLFLNSVAWTLQDESMISIRPRQDANSRVELTQKTGYAIFLLTVIVLPLLIAASGIAAWALRKRL